MIFLFILSVSSSFLFLKTESLVVVKELGFDDPVDQFIDEEAFFGPRIQDTLPLIGRLVLSNPIEGCANSIPIPENTSLALGFIALIRRGNCSFDFKVRAAYTGGYAAAVIFNDINDDVFPMGPTDGSPVAISSVLVGLSDGTKLKNHYCYPPNKYIIEIVANHPWDIKTYLIPVISLLGLFVVGLLILGAFRLCDQYRKRQRRCLTVAQLRQIPLSNYTKGVAHSDTCAICLEEYADGDQLRTLPCKHTYHSKCVDPWLLKGRRVCPICKRAPFRYRTRGRTLFSRWRTTNGEDAEHQQLLSDSDSIEDENSFTANTIPSTSYGAMGSTQLMSKRNQKDGDTQSLPNSIPTDFEHSASTGGSARQSLVDDVSPSRSKQGHSTLDCDIDNNLLPDENTTEILPVSSNQCQPASITNIDVNLLPSTTRRFPLQSDQFTTVDNVQVHVHHSPEQVELSNEAEA